MIIRIGYEIALRPFNSGTIIFLPAGAVSAFLRLPPQFESLATVQQHPNYDRQEFFFQIF
jgi:hypothetical protein